MRRTLLIDADITIYKVASKNEVPTRFFNGLWVLWADEEKTKWDFDDQIKSIIEETEAECAPPPFAKLTSIPETASLINYNI